MLVFMLGTIQFINILDFMMVTPLGPDYAADLGIPMSNLGWVAGSYGIAAATAGIAGTFFLDRFERRTAIGVALAGLAIGTALGGFAIGLKSLLLSRVLAGLFGGPATALAFSILTDLVPVERRGRALSAMMGAFSIAAVLGVPFGLWLSRHSSWKMPFFVVAGLGLTLGVACVLQLPRIRHPSGSGNSPAPLASVAQILRRREVKLSLCTIAASMTASFLVIPNMASFFQLNRDVPRADLEYIYAVGGACSFVSLRIVGWLVDRYGSPIVALGGTVMLSLTLISGFILSTYALPAVMAISLFMVAQSARNVAATTLSSRVPHPTERARYQSMISSVQHIASSVGAFLGSVILQEAGTPARIIGMPRLIGIALGFFAMQPILVVLVNRALSERSGEQKQIEAPDSLPPAV